MMLLAKDEELGKPRDKKLSTGFPIGSEIEKSFSRFWTQFIGYVRSDGELTGALFELQFAEAVSNQQGDYVIALNPQGAEFAALSNPVIDMQSFENSLSEEEKQFYLRHIEKFVSGEVFAFFLTLSLISDGTNRREDLDEQILRKADPEKWTRSLASTQRGGTISRLYELDLLEKVKSGNAVVYRVSEQGQLWLERIKRDDHHKEIIRSVN
jgi:hypothetical protein